MKRFYKCVAVEADPESGGYRVCLDRRPVKTPAKAVLSVSREALAAAISEEWDRQGEQVDPRSMPLTALACTTLDIVAAKRAAVVDEVVAYGGHDLLCYRAVAPADLAARQNEVWQPLLDWAALALDAPLKVTSEVASVTQDPVALKALRGALEAVEDIELAALSMATAATGSLVLAMALRAGHLDVARTVQAAQLDELYQAERWGDDADTARRRAGIEAELRAAQKVFEICALSAGR